MIGLLTVLLGLLALSVGYRPERSAVGQIRASLRILRRLARKDPARYGPALAHHLGLLALELRDSGRPAQALMASMTAVDILRSLDAQDHTRFERDLADALALEDALRDTVGVTADTDLFAVAQREEERLAEASALERGGVPDGDGASRARRLLIWQVALAVWLLSVIALVSVSFFGS